MRTLTFVAALSATALCAPPSFAWQPTKPIEFVATAGPGGGTDNFARAVQAAIVKNKLVDQPIVVVNKPGGSGADSTRARNQRTCSLAKIWDIIGTSFLPSAQCRP